MIINDLKEKMIMIYDTAGKKTTENCDPRTNDVIGQNFEKSSSHEINL